MGDDVEVLELQIPSLKTKVKQRATLALGVPTAQAFNASPCIEVSSGLCCCHSASVACRTLSPRPAPYLPSVPGATLSLSTRLSRSDPCSMRSGSLSLTGQRRLREGHSAKTIQTPTLSPARWARLTWLCESVSVSLAGWKQDTSTDTAQRYCPWPPISSTSSAQCPTSRGRKPTVGSCASCLWRLCMAARGVGMWHRWRHEPFGGEGQASVGAECACACTSCTAILP